MPSQQLQASRLLKPDEAAAAGAAWLDQRYPGWFVQINAEVLDLGDCSWCILGQLFDEYTLAVAEHAVEWFGHHPGRHNASAYIEFQHELALLGFTIDSPIPAPIPASGVDNYYEALSGAWRREIADRLAGAEVIPGGGE